MKVYNKTDKIEKNCLEFYRKIVLNCTLECMLIIDDSYYIERYVSSEHIHYVHIKDNGRTIDKICVYCREKDK